MRPVPARRLNGRSGPRMCATPPNGSRALRLKGCPTSACRPYNSRMKKLSPAQKTERTTQPSVSAGNRKATVTQATSRVSTRSAVTGQFVTKTTANKTGRSK